MHIGRRAFIALGGAAFLSAVIPEFSVSKGDKQKMYGLIGKMVAVPGKREALTSILLEGTSGMPGCLSYVIANDVEDDDAIWVTEVWDSQASHEASLSLPSVQEAISEGKPLIAEFGERFVTKPVGGYGLSQGGPDYP